MRHDITFYVSVFSKEGALLEKFPLRAPTKTDAEKRAPIEAKNRHPNYDHHKLS